MLTPLKLPYLERRSKRIKVAESWRDAIGLDKRADLMKALVEIRKYISQDLDLPARYYRANRDTTPDRLLEEDGIMHLHMGAPDTPELLFLVQFERDVVLLELSNHYHFDLEPPGTVLRQLHNAKLAEWKAYRIAETERFKATIRTTLLGD